MSSPCARKLCGVLSVLALATVARLGSAEASRCPSLTIVLERSGSMLLDLAGHSGPSELGKTRWGIAAAAIERAVATYNNRLPLGLTLFPADNLCGSAERLRIAPAYDTQAAISRALTEADSIPDGGGMPTCGAIRRTAQALAAESRASYVLLVTDGLPSCDETCSFNPQDPAAAAVAAISAAASASHPVKTFVLGIGTLPQTARSALTRMAAAGGVPDSRDPVLKFFGASDVATLDAALGRIMGSVLTDPVGVTCDDSCVKNGCPEAGQVCLHGRCAADPCLALGCRSGEYCYSTGSAAKCVAACDKSCPTGSRCSLGVCVHEACAEACAPGSKCDATTGAGGTCVTDPACAAVKCADGQACVSGTCHEDPCRFTTCPSGLSCVAFDGSCVTMGLLPAQMETTEQLGVGCAVSDPASRRSAVSAAVLFYLVGLVLLARRQQRRV